MRRKNLFRNIDPIAFPFHISFLEIAKSGQKRKASLDKSNHSPTFLLTTHHRQLGRHPKVANLELPILSNENIRRLDIQMDHLAPVDVLQALRNVAQCSPDFELVEIAGKLVQIGLQRAAGTELHLEIEMSPLFPGVEELHTVLMSTNGPHDVDFNQVFRPMK